MNKELCNTVDKWNNSILWCTVKKSSNQRHLFMARTDYKKAFDSLPHTWIDTVTGMYRICPTIRQFVEASMKEWKDQNMALPHQRACWNRKMAIKRGIFQGDPLSPLLFCLALTNMLNKQGARYEVKGKNKIRHVSYMDDWSNFPSYSRIWPLLTHLAIIYEWSLD
jgi:hypothetical protein